jgi:hypothetical protein
VPGSILVSATGDVTVGYPKYSLNSTGVYTFSEGRLRWIPDRWNRFQHAAAPRVLLLSDRRGVG